LYFAYLDESGDPGSLAYVTSGASIILVIGAVIVSSEALRELTCGFLNLKQRFFPGLLSPRAHSLDLMLEEIKGNELKKMAVSVRSRERKTAIGFLDGVTTLLKATGTKLVARVWVKAPGQPLNGTAVYTSSVQSICDYFQSYLSSVGAEGVLVADSVMEKANTRVCHSVFTQKFRAKGDPLNLVLVPPLFAGSQNHAALQIADCVFSGILNPMVIVSYCQAMSASSQFREEYSSIKARYSSPAASSG
jgi:hypothetical protein